MRTILLLAVCVCGAMSVLYAAVTDVGASRPASSGNSPGLTAELKKMTELQVTLGALAHEFTPIAETPGECDFE